MAKTVFPFPETVEKSKRAQKLEKAGVVIETETLWLIETAYYLDEELVKTTRSFRVNTAVRNCFHHMQENDYGANIATVVDGRIGKLHAVILRSVEDKPVVKAVYEEPVKKGN